MPSFPNFINFLKNHPDLPSQKSELLNNIIFRSPTTVQITISHLASMLNVPGIEAFHIAQGLVEAKVFESSTLRCPQCGDPIGELGEGCPRCGHELIDYWTFNVDGCMTKEEQGAYLEFMNNRVEAGLFAEQWLRQGYIYYLLIDLAESENLQELDNNQYNAFYEDIRQRLKSKALSQTRMSLCLGEVGDCIKLAFMSSDDVIAALDNLAEIIRSEDWASRFPSLIGKEAPFPRFDGTLGKVSFHNKDKTPRKLLCVTLSGALDFNDYELTRLFRFDQVIKTDKRIYKDVFVSVWMQDQVLADLDWTNVATVPIVAKSHGSNKTSDFGLVIFPGLDGASYSAIERPIDFKA